MATPQKAEIRYQIGEGDSAQLAQLRFHSVVAEAHDISTEVTKFPVQSGFSISNHAIKKNKKVTIKGLVSDHVLSTKEALYGSSSSNSRIVFQLMQQLVRQATPCTVLTNLATYDPVIFTKLTTEQAAGKTDILEFTMVGEEVQVGATVDNQEAPLLVFNVLTDEERQAVVDELAQEGIEVSDTAEVSQAQGDMHKGFKAQGTNNAGQSVTCTWEKTGYDATTDTIQYNIHSSDTEGYSNFNQYVTILDWAAILKEEREFSAFLTPDDPAQDVPKSTATKNAAVDTFSACLYDQVQGLILETAEDYIDTMLGKARKSVYGFIYNTLGAGGLGSTPLGAAFSECLVAGAWTTQGTVSADDYQDNDWPTTEQIKAGAAKEGNKTIAGATRLSAPTTFTKIREKGIKEFTIL